jgi:hypothetical protein
VNPDKQNAQDKQTTSNKKNIGAEIVLVVHN